MFQPSSVKRTVIATFVSAMMAFPAPLWAERPSSNDTSGSSTEGIPVILQPLRLQDGRTGYVVIAPYLDQDEENVIKHYAENDPKHLILGVAGPDDPALKFALETGNLSAIHTYQVADVDSMAGLELAPKSIRQRLKDKLKSIGNFVREKHGGLITAVIVSGIVSGYVSVHTKSLTVGALVFAALFSWAGYQALASHRWEIFLQRGGEIFKSIFSRVLGKHASETAGMFSATWAANSVVQAGVLGASGAFAGLGSEEGALLALFDGALQSLWYGLLSSTDILDGAVLQKIKQGKFPIQYFGKFVLLRMIAAASFEVAGYAHIPGVQLALATVTSFTLIYMAFRKVRQNIDYTAAQAAEALKNSMLRARAGVGKAIYASQLMSCDVRLLSKKNISITRGEPAE